MSDWKVGTPIKSSQVDDHAKANHLEVINAPCPFVNDEKVTVIGDVIPLVNTKTGSVVYMAKCENGAGQIGKVNLPNSVPEGSVMKVSETSTGRFMLVKS